MEKNNSSIIATPFFKQLISREKDCDFLVDKSKCLVLFKHLKGKEIESREFRRLNLSLFLKEYRESGQYYPCMLIKENFSWISCDEKGEYRYFSSKPNGRVFVFDIIDLIQVNYKMNYKELIDFFKVNLSISVKNEFLREESDKYLENIELIKKYSNEDDNFKELLKNKEDIYEELNRIGLENLFSKTLTHGSDAIFFASTGYIHKRLNSKYSVSTINKVINMLSVVGVLTKIEEHQIPLEFREGNIKKVRNFTSYYSMPRLSECIDESLGKVKVLTEKKLNYYNLTKKQVLEVFGEEVFSDVYVQRTYEGKYNSQNERGCLLDVFFGIYKEKGFVSKDLFYQCAPTSYSKTFIFKEFDEIVKLNGFKMVKPNNRMKKRFSLKSNASVAIKY